MEERIKLNNERKKIKLIVVEVEGDSLKIKEHNLLKNNKLNKKLKIACSTKIII